MKGIGVMLNELLGGGGNDRGKAIQQSLNKTITKAELDADKNALFISFEDQSKLRLWDDGQSCCETRYMHTDDDLSYHVGAQLLEAELRSGPDVEDEDGETHEVQFLAIKTSKGEFVISNHNEHNGYYGGFYINAELEEVK